MRNQGIRVTGIYGYCVLIGAGRRLLATEGFLAEAQDQVSERLHCRRQITKPVTLHEGWHPSSKALVDRAGFLIRDRPGGAEQDGGSLNPRRQWGRWIVIVGLRQFGSRGRLSGPLEQIH